MGKDYVADEKDAYKAAWAMFETMIDPLENFDDYTLADIQNFLAHFKNALAQIPNNNLDDTTMSNMLLETPKGDYGKQPRAHPAILFTCTTTVDGKTTEDYNLADKNRPVTPWQQGIPTAPCAPPL